MKKGMKKGIEKEVIENKKIYFLNKYEELYEKL